MKKFKNTAKPITKSSWGDELRSNQYRYDQPSDYLRLWGRSIQAVVSQAATHKFTGKFHEQECGIYKAEGGCKIVGINELVLGESSCYFDWGRHAKGKAKELQEEQEAQCAELLTKLVLEWDPMDPVESMFKSAAEWLGMTPEDFKAGVENAQAGGVFGGDALWTFFGPNRRFDMNTIRDYRRYCLVTVGDSSDADVDRLFADEDLGKELLDAMIKKCNEAEPDTWLRPLCCSPRRGKDDKLAFWINTGRSTQIDGWKTEAEIREYLDSDGKLVDKAKY